MWSDWLIFCDCGFQSICPLMEKDKRLMEASWWERLTESCSDGQGHSQFSSVQSLSHVRLFETPWISAHQASLSITNSQSSLRRTSIISWVKATISPVFQMSTLRYREKQSIWGHKELLSDRVGMWTQVFLTLVLTLKYQRCVRKVINPSKPSSTVSVKQEPDNEWL